MRILICDHFSLSMSRVALHRLYVTTGKFKFVGDTGMPQTTADSLILKVFAASFMIFQVLSQE